MWVVGASERVVDRSFCVGHHVRVLRLPCLGGALRVVLCLGVRLLAHGILLQRARWWFLQDDLVARGAGADEVVARYAVSRAGGREPRVAGREQVAVGDHRTRPVQ
jgi:hypothetical protein